MKSLHLFLLLITALIIASFSACSGHSDSGTDGDDTTAVTTYDDSLSYFWGRQLGLNTAMAFSRIDSAHAAEVSIHDYLTGATNALMSDFENPSLVKGLYSGISLAKQLDLFESADIPVDRRVAQSEYHRSLLLAQPDTIEAAALEAIYASLLERVQTRILARLKQQRTNQRKMMSRIRTENAARSAEFLSTLLASDSAIITVDSTLAYKRIAAGSGPLPAESDYVTFRYTLTDCDGTVIDSSEGEPSEGRLSDIVIGALRQGMLMMPEGSHYVFYITNNGSRSALSAVQPGKLIIADVELISFAPKKK